jgi:hypothetical protein
MLKNGILYQDLAQATSTFGQKANKRRVWSHAYKPSDFPFKLQALKVSYD